MTTILNPSWLEMHQEAMAVIRKEQAFLAHVAFIHGKAGNTKLADQLRDTAHSLQDAERKASGAIGYMLNEEMAHVSRVLGTK